MTIMGCGGTGKSVLINTLVACIRKIFNDNDTVFVTAPTGAAAYNVGGSTIHREFKINVKDIPSYDKMYRTRISNITRTKNGTETEKIKKRTKWTKYLVQHKYEINISNHQKKKMIKWANKTKTPQLTIYNIIKDNTWQNSDMINY